MSGVIVTTGISVGSGPDGPVPIRKEIRSLQNDFPDQWTLYLLGLKVFQEADQDDLLSYYRIAGIHGRPYRPWNDVTGNGPQQSGYCTHASILFPTWHRPYLSLFEEILYQIVQKKATEFPESEGRSRYVAAAKDFRMPYWDWAAVLPSGSSAFPPSLAAKSLNVVTPTSGGKPTPIENPLYSYKFHPVNPVPGDFVDPQVDTWPETVRWPLNGTSDSQNEKIAEQIELLNADSSSNIREKVFGIIASYRRYGPFSNKSWTGVAGEYGSLEDVHDTIHVITGGQGSTSDDTPGNMQMVPYAAFDPVFWLHHTNVDRLFAIWQALNPNSYVTSQAASEATVTTSVGTQETKTTNLTPFWASETAFWDSDGIRKTGSLGYAYPETQAWKFSTPQQYRANVSATLRQLYGGSSLASIIAESTPGNLSPRAQLNVPVRASVRLAPKAPADQPTVSAQAEPGVTATSSKVGVDTAPVEQAKLGQQKPLAEAKTKPEEPKAEPQHGDAAKVGPKHDDQHTAAPKHPDITDLAENGKHLEWLTNFKVEKHSLGGTFTVQVFLGEFDRENPLAWISDPNKVGSFNVLGDSQDTGCQKCRDDRESGLKVTGQVPLTLALAERYLAGLLPNLKPEGVIPYLQKNLHWRVILANGAEFPRGQVPSLTVSVISNEVTIPTAHDQLPQFAPDVTIHSEVTTALNGDGRGEGTGLTDPGQV